MLLKDIVESTGVLSELNACKGMPGRVSYAVSKNIALAKTELDAYEKARKDIAEKYSIKDDKDEAIIIDGKYDIPENKLDECNKEIMALLDEEVSIEFKKLNPEELDKAELSPSEFAIIDFMIQD